MAEAEERAPSDAVVLDRMEIEDVGANPQHLAEAIHLQLGGRSGAVPVHAIARALDIDEIQEKALTSMEGGLVTTPERGYGSILVNRLSSPQRRRFTVGHELGHFLNPWHKPTTPTGFKCSRLDMRVASGAGRHLRQEAEANAFAAELLMPRNRLVPFLRQAPDLGVVLSLAEVLDVSKAAAVRRYVDLHDVPLAVIFSHNGCCQYIDSGKGFPALARLRKGDPMPWLLAVGGEGGSKLTEAEETDSKDWLRSPATASLTVQTLYQQHGYATTLLIAETDDDGMDEEDGVEDSYSRYTRFGD